VCSLGSRSAPVSRAWEPFRRPVPTLTLARQEKEKRKIMPPFLYRCPNTGDNVQAWAADDPEDDNLTYVQVTCLARAQAHLVNPKNGKVLGSDDE
jgi:hypothetical protein